MYDWIRVGNRFFVVDPNGQRSKWFTYRKSEAQRKARELDAARAQHFEVIDGN